VSLRGDCLRGGDRSAARRNLPLRGLPEAHRLGISRERRSGACHVPAAAREPKIYVKRGDSGARRAQAFCADCGSPLYTFDADRDDDYGLRVGCIDQRRALVPRRQIWCGSALDWAFDIGSLPRRDAE
jgi:hypothetical protein